MDKDETWALFKQGKEAWNAWAEDMLAKRKQLEEAGEWRVDLSSQGQNKETNRWLKDAEADFSDRGFTAEELPGGVNFNGFIFPGVARFDSAKFGGVTRFNGAIFGGTVQFNWAVFQGEVGFDGAVFQVGAWFGGVVFHADAWFNGAMFSGTAGFSVAVFHGGAWFGGAVFNSTARFFQANFQNYTEFQNVQFKESTEFGAIEVKRAFNLAGATFHQVPDFIQANFAQAPRLDDLSIEPQSLQRLFWLTVAHFRKRSRLTERRRVLGAAWRGFRRAAHNWKPFSREIEREARWRSVKKLANEAHDHAREQEFFAEELKARRNASSFKEALIWFVSLLYQGLSNFGRSLVLPFIWLIVTAVVFGSIYLGNHRDYVRVEAGCGDACVVGPPGSEAMSAARALSLRNTIPFAGLGAPEKLNQVYRCLYGVEGAATAGPNFPLERLPPRIPDRVIFWGVLQTVISAVLIFLFLLAVRNHFRIK